MTERTKTIHVDGSDYETEALRRAYSFLESLNDLGWNSVVEGLEILQLAEELLEYVPKDQIPELLRVADHLYDVIPCIDCYSRKANQWNDEHPIGTAVSFFDEPSEEQLLGRTVSRAIASTDGPIRVVIDTATLTVDVRHVRKVSPFVELAMQREGC